MEAKKLPRYSNAYRIGLIVPSLNVTIEPEFNAYAPSDVSVHATRLLLPKGDIEHLAQMAQDTEPACDLLATAKVNVIAYACTSGSLVKGIEWERILAKRMESRVRVPAVTTASAVIDALHKLHLSKVAVGTPYIEEVNAAERKFLENNGIAITQIKGLGYVEGETLHMEPPETAMKLAEAVDSSEAEGIFLSCTDPQDLYGNRGNGKGSGKAGNQQQFRDAVEMPASDEKGPSRQNRLGNSVSLTLFTVSDLPRNCLFVLRELSVFLDVQRIGVSRSRNKVEHVDHRRVDLCRDRVHSSVSKP